MKHYLADRQYLPHLFLLLDLLQFSQIGSGIYFDMPNIFVDLNFHFELNVKPEGFCAFVKLMNKLPKKSVNNKVDFVFILS